MLSRQHIPWDVGHGMRMDTKWKFAAFYKSKHGRRGNHKLTWASTSSWVFLIESVQRTFPASEIARKEWLWLWSWRKVLEKGDLKGNLKRDFRPGWSYRYTLSTQCTFSTHSLHIRYTFVTHSLHILDTFKVLQGDGISNVVVGGCVWGVPL